jgi:hypothetical protein
MLLTNCADAILAKSGERNGAHGDAPAVVVASCGGFASSVAATTGRIVTDASFFCEWVRQRPTR